MAKTENNTQQEIEQATFGAGCFWCVLFSVFAIIKPRKKVVIKK
jgi:peptide methionine sulfoxide reductase MsrA